MDMFRTLSASMRHPPPVLEVYAHYTAMIYRFYNHLKVKHVNIVSTPLRTCHLF